jgi:tetratricopeptide (TPR) repeat protein
MTELSKYLSPKDNALIKKIVSLINGRKYDACMNLIHKRLTDNINISTQAGAMLKAELAGRLIDIGEEGRIERAVLYGLNILENDRNQLGKYIHEGSLEYNLGNAKNTLFKIQLSNPNFKYSPQTIKQLSDAKNHYWKAYKLLPPDEESIRPQLIVNLANTLSSSGRIAEALQYYDLVISRNPNFSMANVNRSEALLWLNNLSDTYSINLLQQAMEGYDRAAESSDLPKWMIKLFGKKRDWLKRKLKKLGYTEEDIAHGLEETKAESETHSNYRKFYIENHLCLSEHSLYCNCLGARHDDLTIPKTSEPIGGDFVPRMELLLNRLKSEFALARLLYYQSDPKHIKNFKTFDEEITFTELYENEAVGARREMLRSSFRMCFGILDKIAYGICDLFDIADPHEPLYFESFWKPRGRRLSTIQKERWSKINSIDNFSLLALYSQATDLNTINGEWGIFKGWRNALEHKMLILTLGGNLLDAFRILGNQRAVKIIDYKEFEMKTLHLLRLTRSAIFNFVFCVRREGTKEKSKSKGKALTITLDPKLL